MSTLSSFGVANIFLLKAGLVWKHLEDVWMEDQNHNFTCKMEMLDASISDIIDDDSG